MNRNNNFPELSGEEKMTIESSIRTINRLPSSNAASQSGNNSISSCSSEPRDNNATDTIISGMIPALFVGQCFSLLPVSNAACKDGHGPHFSWLSLRVLYSGVVSFEIMMIAIFAISFYIQNHIMTVVSFQTVLFFLSNFLSSCLFIRLAGRWPLMCTAFQEVENRMSFYGNFSDLNGRMRTLTAVMLMLTLVEHVVSVSTILLRIERLSNHSEIDWLPSYYDAHFGFVAFHVPFSPLIFAVTAAINAVAVFIGNYNDLFIVLISMAIASKFQHLNDILIATFHKVKDDRSWKHVRETYDAIRTLAATAECSLSPHVLLSFANNFFFICVMLIHTARYNMNTAYESCYFVLSFLLLVLRAVSVSLFAAAIYEKSQAFKQVLFSVPSENYSVEVKRFLKLVSFDDVVLTGCNYFNVTRSFLLGVFGAIAAYVIVLAQLQGVETNEQ